MCSIDKLSNFYDPIFNTKNKNELINTLQHLSESDFMQLKLDQLKQIAINLGISGIKSLLTKSKVYTKINLAIKANISDITYDIPPYKYMIFDTETTLGFGSNRLLQLSFRVFSGMKSIYEYDTYIKPCGFQVTGTEIHGIDEQIAYSKGIDIKDALRTFLRTIEEMNIDILVSHNFPFDKDVLQRESIMADMKLFPDDDGNGKIERKLRYVDTCRCSTILTYVQVKKSLTRSVFPSLETLYQVCTNSPITITHNSFDDTRVLSECLFFLLKIGVIFRNKYIVKI